MSAEPPPRLICIVTGDGEVQAVPILVRRIAQQVAPLAVIDCPRPFRSKQDRLVRHPEELERAVQYARLQIERRGAILVLIDSEGELPCVRGPELLQRARRAAAGIDVGVVLAHREFEAWFLAAAESLRGQCELPLDLVGPPDPERISDAKGWLRARMPRARRYRETRDQAALTAGLDLQAARRAPSFDKCYREVARLITALTGPPP